MAVGGGESQNSQSRNREHEERVVLDTRPCYVRYSLRGLGVFSGGLCMLFGVLNIIFHLFSIVCLIFSIIQSVLGFFVATTEAAGGSVRVCHCIFLSKLPGCYNWVEKQPLWVKPLFYILAPLMGMLFCTTVWTVIGGGAVLFTGVVYSISLWKQVPSNPPSPDPTPENNNFTPTTTSTTAGNNKVITHHNQALPTQPARPTVIDIRPNNNNMTNSTLAGNSSQSYVKTSPIRNPLASITTYDPSASNFKTVNLDEDGESGGNNRYENISVISGHSSKNMTNSPSHTLEMETRQHGYYSNVDLDDGAGAYPDNPFVTDWKAGNIRTQKSQNVDRNDDEYNC